MLAEFEDGCREFGHAMGVGEEEDECYIVTRLLLQIRGIPLHDTKWYERLVSPYRSYEYLSKEYQEKATGIIANRGVKPFLRYLHSPQIFPSLTKEQTVGDVLGIRRQT